MQPGELKTMSWNVTFHKCWSIHYFTGAEGRVYWSLYEGLPNVEYGIQKHKYSKKEEALVLENHLDDRLTPTLTFRDLYEALELKTRASGRICL